MAGKRVTQQVSARPMRLWEEHAAKGLGPTGVATSPTPMSIKPPKVEVPKDYVDKRETEVEGPKT